MPRFKVAILNEEHSDDDEVKEPRGDLVANGTTVIRIGLPLFNLSLKRTYDAFIIKCR